MAKFASNDMNAFKRGEHKEICALCGSYISIRTKVDEYQTIFNPSLFEKHTHMQDTHRIINDPSRAEIITKYFVNVDNY